MDLTLFKEESSTMSVADEVFNKAYNESLIHQLVVAFQAKQRAGTKGQKSRADVAGGGAKPWRQKGTGRARAGTNSSPIWRSGGVTFAARNRNYEQKLNKKMYRAGMRSILSELVRQKRIHIVDAFVLPEAKTKAMVVKLKEMEIQGRTLIVLTEVNENIMRASQNLHKITVCLASEINPLLLIRPEQVVITKDGVSIIEGLLK